LVFVYFHKNAFTESVETAARVGPVRLAWAHTPSPVGAAEPVMAAANCIMVHCINVFSELTRPSGLATTRPQPLLTV
jgi:hypothetical protein